MTKLIYISHWRFPSEKTMSPLIMKTCEGFARMGIRVELWVPWRNNRGFSQLDPFEYHGVERNFKICRLPAVDFTGFLPGSFFFFLMLASFSLSLFVLDLVWATAQTKSRTKRLFYFHDVRDAFLFSLVRRPIFLEVHDFYKSGAAWINNIVFPSITGFIVTNRYKIDVLRHDFGVSREKMLHQPNAVDVKMFKIGISKEEARAKLSLAQDQRIILYTGHLFYWKGVDTLLEAARFLSGNEIVYFVGGTDDDIKKYRQMANGKGQIVIVGRQPHQEIPFWQRAADVLVLPNTAKFPESKFETSPVKLFEYMASGRPVVASDLPSIRNVVDENMAFFAEADNPRSFADTIHYVFSHGEEAERRAETAQREVGQYSWGNRATHIVNFINSLIYK